MLPILAVLALAISDVSATSPANPYAGRWRLDPARSEGMPAFYSAIREHLLDITQTDSTFTVDVILTDTAGAVRREQFPFSLRGSVKTTTTVRTLAIPTTLTATISEGRVEVDIAREVTMRGEVLRPTDRESWRLSEDGQTLSIDRVAEMPRPEGLTKFTIRYVFVRA